MVNIATNKANTTPIRLWRLHYPISVGPKALNWLTRNKVKKSALLSKGSLIVCNWSTRANLQFQDAPKSTTVWIYSERHK